MGRPIERRFFGNLSAQSKSNTSGVGGEGVASVAAVTGLSGMTYLTGGPYTILAADIGAPQIPGGVKPVLTFQPTSATAGTVTVVSAGSGYTGAPTVTVRGSLAAGSGTATPTVTLTTGRQNAFAPQAWVAGDTGAALGDIIKQTGARSFLVKTAAGTSKCVLVPNAPAAAGQMSITATKADTTTFYVRKITGRKVWDTDGVSYAWTLGAASGAVVSLASN